MQAWRKVMVPTAGDDLKKDTCGMTACTPGSAPGPTLGIEYGRTLTFNQRRSNLKEI